MAKKKAKTIDERLDGISQALEIVSGMQHDAERRFERVEQSLEKLEKMQQRTDKRINALLTITLKIGADFAERIKKLEEK